MKSIFDELRSPEDKPLSEENIAYVVQMNSLYRAGLITKNELRIGLGGQSIGVAGDRFASEDSSPITRNLFDQKGGIQAPSF